jgi:hypothetical protein
MMEADYQASILVGRRRLPGWMAIFLVMVLWRMPF